MADKQDGTPQSQHGGRKHGSKAKTKLGDIADPTLLLESRLGPGELLPSLTREEKDVFQKATSIAYERWVEESQLRARSISLKALELLEAKLDKIPPSYLALTALQLAQYAKREGAQVGATTQNLNVNVKASPEEIKGWLFGGKPVAKTEAARPTIAPPPA